MSEFFSGIIGAAGEFVRVYTLVDYYSYIKAVEYLICIGFFVTFPLFYKYVIKRPDERKSILEEKRELGL